MGFFLDFTSSPKSCNVISHHPPPYSLSQMLEVCCRQIRYSSDPPLIQLLWWSRLQIACMDSLFRFCLLWCVVLRHTGVLNWGLFSILLFYVSPSRCLQLLEGLKILLVRRNYCLTENGSCPGDTSIFPFEVMRIIKGSTKVVGIFDINFVSPVKVARLKVDIWIASRGWYLRGNGDEF